MSAMELGAALYVPSTKDGLEAIVNGLRWPDLRAVILCTEDAIRPEDTGLGIARIGALLDRLDPDGPKRFVRARNPEVLRRLFDLPGIEAIDGFVLPKVDTRTLDGWIDAATPGPGLLMPTLETPEVFDQARMIQLRKLLDGSGLRERILCLRIGGNDLLAALATRRPRGKTAYTGPLGWAISQLAGTFIPNGYALSAPVFESLEDATTLREEIALDLEHGLIGKTAIHPVQLPWIHELYRVCPAELDEAERILAPAAPAVFRSRGTMCEPATHRRWAEGIRRRAALYGVRPPDPAIEPPCTASAAGAVLPFPAEREHPGTAWPSA